MDFLQKNFPLFKELVFERITKFLKTPVQTIFSVLFFILSPSRFVSFYSRLYENNTIYGNEPKLKTSFVDNFVVEHTRLGKMFSGTWLAIIAVFSLYELLDVSSPITEIPILSSLVIGLVFQLTYWTLVYIYYQNLNLFFDSRIGKKLKLMYSSYYVFIAVFPVMVIVLILWQFGKIGEAFTGDPWVDQFVMIGVGIALEKELPYLLTSFFAFIYILFIHPIWTIWKSHQISIARVAATYIYAALLFVGLWSFSLL